MVGKWDFLFSFYIRFMAGYNGRRQPEIDSGSEIGGNRDGTGAHRGFS